MECNQKRDVEIPDCKEKNPGDCHRTFHLYLPRIICDNGSKSRGLKRTGDTTDSTDEQPVFTSVESVGTLPLVFAIHCFGCKAESINTFIAHADKSNAVLVIPEGLHSSFNARHCCGYAVENEIDDVGFLKNIQTSLSDEYPFIQSDYSYAVGWSNGGFMVMHAASLFRSISPISGYQYDIDPSVKKGGTFCVDGICVDAPGSGKGIFLHHSVDDTFVRPTGCCNDPNTPKCCCNIAADTCVPIMQVAQNWALEVNGCELAEKDEPDSTGENKEGDNLDGKGEGEGNGEEKEKEADDATSTTGEEDSGSTSKVNGERRDEVEEEEALGVPGARFVTSFTDSGRGIECFTTGGTDCKANSTICLHHSGHFNSPNFGEKFPFAKEVIDFFAKDACEIHDGTWDEINGLCACPENRGGAFCLDDLVITENVSPDDVDDFYIMDLEAASSKRSWKAGVGYFFFILAVWYGIRHRCKRGKKKVDSYSHDVRDEEATELVSSQGFGAN
eukprot:CAMPEP_0172551704 /NCGR_PEP_ID=MMETSP1067-20121228/40206_1 /TAXON_ID=265564 ORGANISM="Thalassiosira punctigera, Strain Tpunct2005C2" /NCGR_SAMPLE_ID=MMETSP1067 /ASSEMBLY_ACC=CAM_ASM_000444 /LENGTH=501 /DNA_ID=CAMNT_0013339517 /DNA_START=103 /DNA_END=1608 /DNA_ORIENTATION=+